MLYGQILALSSIPLHGVAKWALVRLKWQEVKMRKLGEEIHEFQWKLERDREEQNTNFVLTRINQMTTMLQTIAKLVIY